MVVVRIPGPCVEGPRTPRKGHRPQAGEFTWVRKVEPPKNRVNYDARQCCSETRKGSSALLYLASAGRAHAAAQVRPRVPSLVSGSCGPAVRVPHAGRQATGTARWGQRVGAGLRARATRSVQDTRQADQEAVPSRRSAGPAPERRGAQRALRFAICAAGQSD